VQKLDRSYWLSAGLVAYVAFASAQRTQHVWLAWSASIVLPAALALLWRRVRAPERGLDSVSPVARQALRVIGAGVGLWLAARIGEPGQAGLDAAANLGTGAATLAALVALARLPGPGGLLKPPRAASSLDAAAFAGLITGIAVAVPAAIGFFPRGVLRLDPLAIDYVTAAAGFAGLLILLVAALRLRWLRELELGVGDRAAGAVVVLGAAVLVAVPATLVGLAPPDRVLPATLLLACLGVGWVTVTQRPALIARLLRGLMVVLLLGVPVALLAALFVVHHPKVAPLVVVASSGLAFVVGLVAKLAARLLGPEQSRWLMAFDHASVAALRPEPFEAIRACLEELRRAGPAHGTRPELMRLYPPEVISVDVAGYLHTEPIQLPDQLGELAAQEPEGVLRTDVLDAVQVRRPEVRGLLSWFQARQAMSAVVIRDEEEIHGLLVLPSNGRKSPMALEEAHSARRLAERLASLFSLSSSLVRSRQRESAAISQVGELQTELERMILILEADAVRHRAFAERLARPLLTTAHGATARAALQHAAALSARPAVALQFSPGMSPVAWAAAIHLSSPRGSGPLVIVDGSLSPDHGLERWTDERVSPLILAESGTLVVLDLPALPEEVQERIAQRLERVAPGEETRFGCLFTCFGQWDEHQRQGRILPRITRQVAESLLTLPTLVERPEDLRSLLLERLARWGARLRGRPLGALPAAQRLLVDHVWPGNELELEWVCLKAAQAAAAEAVTAAELQSTGFVPTETPPPPSVSTESARARAARRKPLRRG